MKTLAAEQVETVVRDGEMIEVVADKGYHNNQVMVDLEPVGVRSYMSEPDRGRRNWKKHPEARDASIGTSGVFADRAVSACCGSAASD